MLSETICGSLDLAHKHALDLVKHARSQGSPQHLSDMLRLASVVLRAAGSEDLVRSLLVESLEIAEKYRMASGAAASAELLSYESFDSGRLDETRAWIERSQSLGNGAGGPLTITKLLYVRARLALHTAGRDAARDVLSAIEPQVCANDHIVRRKSGLLAIFVQTLTPGSRDHGVVLRALEDVHFRLRGHGRQDYCTYALATGLQQVGEGRRAAELLSEYVQTYRLERYPLAQYLVTLLGGLSRADLSGASALLPADQIQ